jgi:hypothetical protein
MVAGESEQFNGPDPGPARAVFTRLQGSRRGRPKIRFYDPGISGGHGRCRKTRAKDFRKSPGRELRITKKRRIGW